MFGCPRRSCPCNRCQTLCLGSVVTRKAGPGSTPVGSFPGGQLCGSRAVAKRMFFLNFSRQKCSNLMQFAIESSGCKSSWQRTFDRPHVRSEDRGWWWTLALGLRLESFSALHEGLKSIEASLFAGQTWGQGRTVFMQRTVLGMARHFKRQWHYKNWASVSEISWQEPAASACSGSSGFHFFSPARLLSLKSASLESPQAGTENQWAPVFSWHQSRTDSFMAPVGGCGYLAGLSAAFNQKKWWKGRKSDSRQLSIANSLFNTFCARLW